ncbi:transketolase [Gymnopus androsaceus JB14]|uniref:Transketolase n=2 Tax=Gymnopus androsaceus JB14 TaxID=1447944 RepID=A0A6A4H1E4_9AGAR|nr:transketolase [Gymnopus androsaceus JB14]
MPGVDSEFPIDLKQYKKLTLDPSQPQLTDEQRTTLKANIQLLRDVIVFFTATGAARGVSGHTGGAYDTVPEVCILLSLIDGAPDKYAGHRVATQYLLAALEGSLPAEHLLHYRHPELGLTPGVKFSSGRLGHIWPLVNGVAMAHRERTVFCLGSDGSQQEGNDAEAARLAVAQNLNVKLFIDDNDVTIAGHPSEYLKGFEVGKTLEGHGLKVLTVDGEDIDSLWLGIAPHGHDVIPVKGAIKSFSIFKPVPQPYLYIGSTKEVGANRVVMSKEEAAKKVMVIDSDLEGSTGLKVIHQKHPEVFFGVFSTFSAFLEMLVSEITMARLNNCNVLCHFSHAGVDEMADNTCHFGINNMFADNGLSDVESFLYFPADALQMTAVIERVFFEHGLRFVFSTRSKVPYILKPDSESKFFGGDYKFVPGRDEIIVDGTAGYVVSFGDMLHRSYDAVLRCRQEGLNVGLINKPTLNIIDEQMIMKAGLSPFILIVEPFNQKTGLGSRYGTWLLERQLTPKYGYMGATKEGSGGLWEQVFHQNLDSQAIIVKIKALAQAAAVSH